MHNRAAQYFQVRDNIAAACAKTHRDVASVELVAVSKTFGQDAVLPILKAGQRVFGENRVQEAATKWPSLKQQFQDVNLHLIGPLQTNKAQLAVGLFDCIETLDRPKLARILAAEMAKQSRIIELFIQVNTGAEPQKAGVLPEDLDSFLTYCRGELGLKISGLMCIPPRSAPPEKHFLGLAALAKQYDLSKLSMGMSADYETAIACGATHVRVGSAIFGDR